MAQTPENVNAVHPILSAEEGYQIFDHEVRRLMGMDGQEFIKRWEAGEFDEIADKPGNRHIMRLILMMPGDRSKS